VDAIVERRLELRTGKGSLEVVASLARPVKVRAEEWKCDWQVRYGDESKSRPALGGDSMQAFQLAMVTLDVELKQGAARRGGKLFHLNEPFNSILENGGMQLKPLPPKSSGDAA
jgi:hypothetical protein